MHLYSSPSPALYYELTTFGLIAQLVEHCIGVVDVTGSNPVQA